MLHIVDVEAHWLHHVAAGRPRDPQELKTLLSEATAPDGGRWPAPPRRPSSTPGRPRRPCRGRTFTLRWMLHHVIAHEAYHGGQAVMLTLMRRAMSLG